MSNGRLPSTQDPVTIVGGVTTIPPGPGAARGLDYVSADIGDANSETTESTIRQMTQLVSEVIME
jgi:hypothetical protein